MRVCIISYHDSHDYNTRIKYLEAFLHSKGYEIETLISDFDHINKCEYHVERSNTQLIHVKPYTKNLSLERINSYVGFAKSCVKCLLKQGKVDLVYLLAPPNSLIKELALLKRKMKFRFIVEVGDMWPESLPVSETVKTIGKPAFYLWRRIRDKYINDADYVIAECELFRTRLIRNGLLVPSKKVYFCKESLFNGLNSLEFDGNHINLCYLGSINNIIDIDYIRRLVDKLSQRKKVTVHIIGKGECEKDLCDSIRIVGGDVVFYGPIYDDGKKREIVSKCHFALNIMKKSVFVGMTMKSLDYFSMGLPIINSVHGDIWDVIEDNQCGFNSDNPCDIAFRIIELSENKYKQLRDNAIATQENNFSIDIYNRTMESIFTEIK